MHHWQHFVILNCPVRACIAGCSVTPFYPAVELDIVPPYHPALLFARYLPLMAPKLLRCNPLTFGGDSGLPRTGLCLASQLRESCDAQPRASELGHGKTALRGQEEQWPQAPPTPQPSGRRSCKIERERGESGSVRVSAWYRPGRPRGPHSATQRRRHARGRRPRSMAEREKLEEEGADEVAEGVGRPPGRRVVKEGVKRRKVATERPGRV